MHKRISEMTEGHIPLRPGRKPMKSGAGSKVLKILMKDYFVTKKGDRD